MFVGVALGTTTTQAQDPPPSPVPAPVDSAAPDTAFYSARQARRGQDTYRKNCTACHNTAAYAGAGFRRAWSGRSVFELWEQIRTTMPNDSPGRLKLEEYADIVAYLLKLNGIPPGSDELPADAEVLRRLRIIPPSRPGG
jgi:mono/diheme cytochrome c family protein